MKSDTPKLRPHFRDRKNTLREKKAMKKLGMNETLIFAGLIPNNPLARGFSHSIVTTLTSGSSILMVTMRS